MDLKVVSPEHIEIVGSYAASFEGQNMEDTMRANEDRISDEDAAWRGVRESTGRQVLNAAMNTWNAVKYMVELVSDLHHQTTDDRESDER